jgi:type IV pilus assembly protein PilF
MNKRGRADLGRPLLLLLLLLTLTACANKALLQEQAGNHISIGSAYLGSGQFNAALKELLEAEKLTPDDPKVHYLLGVSYHSKGLGEKAVAEFQKAIAFKPDDSEVHNYLGAIYLEQGRWDDAIASFNRALANILYDTPAATRYNLGRAYYEKGQYDLALKQYRAAADTQSVLMPLIEKDMGMVWLAKGDPDEAIGHLKKSLELAPSLAEAHYWLGFSYQRLNRPREAAAAFETAARLSPDSDFGRKAKAQLKATNP